MSKHPLYNNTGFQKDNKSHILYALANKQIELQQLEDEYHIKISKIKSDLSALEVTIYLFDKDCDETITKIRDKTAQKRRNSYFGKREAKRLILTALRTSNKPLKINDISLLCQKAKNISTQDNTINKYIQKIVVEILRKLEKSGLVEVTGKDGLSLIWKIKD